ncbi:outer membrane beta-barrel family protein [Segatella albensis]|uniref:outer membrane beta-barrel family protein n=1 Tax=Segatella albensis TaxID=77768 RepID=UPI0004881FE7|nr:outer membrane beta-barrel family protein [Segatella albensis]
MRNTLTTVIALILGALSMSAQSILCGKIVSENGTPIPYANVILLNQSDSAYISGTIADEKGRFSILTEPNRIIKVSCVGYKDTFINHFKKDSVLITLATSSQLLNEVVVKSSLPVTRIEGNALVTNIKGSILERIGTAKDVLGRLPGIIVEEGTVSVLGKGAPAIYINGQLVRDNHMLEQLQSIKIKKVELITNPGARYDATVSSVIRISAERNPGEGFSFDSKTSVGYRNYPSFSEQVDLNYRYNNLDVFAMLEYDRSKTKGTSANIQNTWLTQHYMQDIGMSSSARQQLYEGKVGFNYSITPNHTFGTYYQASHKPIKVKSRFHSESWIDKVLNETSDVTKETENKTTEHLIDGYYSGMFGEWSLDAAFDLLWKNNENRERSSENFSNSTNRTVTIDDNSKGRLVTGELNASRPLWKGNINMGIGYSRSQRSEESINAEHVIGNTDDEVREDNMAAYVETSQRLGRLNLQLGMRYEHIDSRYYDGGVKMGEQSHIYDNLFPTASLMFPIKKSILMLSYAKKYERPLYSQLSGTVSYVNRYLYQSGNPFLKSQYDDNLSLTFRYRWLILMGNYTYTDGKIIDECQQYGNDGTITLLRKGNSTSALHKYQVIAVFAPHFGIYYPNLMMGVIGQDFHMNYLGTEKAFNKPMFMVRWNNLFHFKQGYLANIDMNWRSSGDSENIRMKKVWSLNTGVTKQFGKCWNVKLSVNDLFNTSMKNDFTIYSGVSDVKIMKRITSRCIECTVRYNFNTTKSKYIGKGAGNAEKERL